MTKNTTLSSECFPSLLKQKLKLLVVAAALLSAGAQAQITITISKTAVSPWTVPVGLSSIKVECWGGGGSGGSVELTAVVTAASTLRGGGGGGGSYAGSTLTGLSSSYAFSIGAGGTAPAAGFANDATGDGQNTTFENILALGSPGAQSKTASTATSVGGAGATAPETGNAGEVVWYGGNGFAGSSLANNTNGCGPGGGSAGSIGKGGNAAGNTSGKAGAAGAGGGTVGAGFRMSTGNGTTGGNPGAGGAGASIKAETRIIYSAGGNGGNGQIKITLNNFTAIAANTTFTVASGETLTIPSGTTFTIETGATLTIATGGTLIVAAGAKITNNGTITNAGTINYLSDSSIGIATYIGQGTISGAGVVNVNQSLQHPAGVFRSWCLLSPVAATVTPSPAFTVIKSFNEALNDPTPANNWVTSTSMSPKVGYMVTPALNANTFLFTGALNNGDQSISITRRAGTENKPGFNLIGNPYLSYLDWTAVCAYTDGTTLNSSLMPSSTLWYPTKVSGTWRYVTVNGDGVTTPKGEATKYIPPMQAFWVRASNATGTLKLTNAMRFHTDAVNNPGPNIVKAPTAKNTAPTLVRLQVSNAVITDEAVIYVSQNAQNGFDQLDAPKMSNDEDTSIPEIYTTLGTEKIAINSMNSIATDSPISLGFAAVNGIAISIKANEISNLPQGVKLILKDNVSNAETDLTDGVTNYQFTPQISSSDRFSIIFRSPGSSAGIESANMSTIKVYQNGSKQLVISAEANSKYFIYNALGQQIENGVLNSEQQTSNRKLQTGVYVVKVNNQSTRVVVK